MLVEQSSEPLDAFSELASVRPGRRPAAHRRARSGSFRLGAFPFARGLGEGSLQAEGAAGGRELVFKGPAPPERTSRRLAALGSARWHESRLSGPRDIRRQQNGTFSGFPGPATRIEARKVPISCQNRPLGAETPYTEIRKVRNRAETPTETVSRLGRSRNAPTEFARRAFADRPDRAAPEGRVADFRGARTVEFGVAPRAPFCGPSSRSALRIGRQGPGGGIEPPASGTKGLSPCPTLPDPSRT